MIQLKYDIGVLVVASESIAKNVNERMCYECNSETEFNVPKIKKNYAIGHNKLPTTFDKL